MAEASLSGNHPESNLQIWGQLLQSLRQIGFAQAGPEYLKLARLVFESRKHQLLTAKPLGRPDDWSRLSSVASEVRELLRPLFEASGILADLPSRIEPLPPAPPPAPPSPAVVADTKPAKLPRATKSGAPPKVATPRSAKPRKASKPVAKTQNKEK
ncbi:MAG TPA: hypothetical protein PKO15_10065 [Fibrobacteria bacterium]|nr:hypothetical protein [Fibrobacteria bacterium]HOX51286.1 hypothetical protein [Fibrobacteria bacterium]